MRLMTASCFILSLWAFPAQAGPGNPALDQARRLALPLPVPEVPVIHVAQPQSLPFRADPCIFDGRAGSAVPAAGAFRRALAAQIVYAGEQHDNAAHHLAQRDLLDMLSSANPRAAAGFEMLYASSHQPFLDRYLAGTLDAAQFQQAVNWRKTWGFPFSLYEPVFDRLRSGSRRGAALNVRKDVVHKVALEGIEALTPEESLEVPPEFQAVADPAYLDMLRRTYKEHGNDPNDEAAFGRYVDAMSLWNEGMAWHLAEFIRKDPTAPILIVAGSFHAYSAAVPSSLARRMPGVRQVSFILQSAPSCPSSLSPADLALDADYIWVVPGPAGNALPIENILDINDPGIAPSR